MTLREFVETLPDVFSDISQAEREKVREEFREFGEVAGEPRFPWAP